MFCYPIDLAIIVDVMSILTVVPAQLIFDLEQVQIHEEKKHVSALEKSYNEFAQCAKWEKIAYKVIKIMDRHTSVVTEGFSEEGVI